MIRCSSYKGHRKNDELSEATYMRSLAYSRINQRKSGKRTEYYEDGIDLIVRLDERLERVYFAIPVHYG